MARGQAQIQCLFVNSSSEEGMQPDQYTNLYIYINIYIYLYIYICIVIHKEEDFLTWDGRINGPFI